MNMFHQARILVRLKLREMATIFLLTLSPALPALEGSISEKEELLRLKNTTLNLIDHLVKAGIIDKDKAKEMVRDAEDKANREAKAEIERQESSRGKGDKAPQKTTGISYNELRQSQGADPAKAPTRVTYVPAIVKDEIKADLRQQLKNEVVEEVKREARNEQWGIPAALPDWVSRIKLFGDMRLRYEDDLFGSTNVANAYYNWPLINQKGGIANTPNPYLNTTQDQSRFLERFRFGAEADIVEGLKANFRLTTTNGYSPISVNQTLGNYNQGFAVELDRAYLQYDYLDEAGHDWMTLWGGRGPNPFLSTDNVWSSEVNLDGLYGTFRMPFGEDDPEFRGYNAPNTAGRLWFTNLNEGFTKPNQIYLTAGFIPIQDTNLSSHLKWLGAGQAGFDLKVDSTSRFKSGIAYYSYQNTQAIRNPVGSTEYNWTAPAFFTQGNSVAVISNGTNPALEPQLVGLASGFNMLDAILQYDYSGFAPNHILVTGNYTHNFGFNQQQILNSLGENITPQTTAYQMRMDIGRPDLLKFGDWNFWLAYKYLQRDSVMDAFNDSNFHMGGTNSKGYVVGMNYAVLRNVWTSLRWLSASAITGPTYDVNVLQADFNARF